MTLSMTSRRSKWSAFAAVAALLALGASGCVPASQYKSTRSALEMEQASNRKMMNELYETRQKLSTAENEAQARDAKSAQQDQALAQAELDDTIQSKKRQNASELVDQLREELGRVGDHLRFFVGQNNDLKKQLAAAQALDKRLEVNALVVRDLALLLHDELATGEVDLAVVNGSAVLRVASSRMFDASGRAVTPEAMKIFSALARVAELHKQGHLSVAEMGLSARVARAERAARLQLVAEGLAHAGLDAGRVAVTEPGSAAAAPSSPSASAAQTSPKAAPAPAAPELDITIDAAPS